MAKTLLPNQHILLHNFYGVPDCCLCKAEQHIKELEKQTYKLRTQLTTLERIDAMIKDTKIIRDPFWLWTEPWEPFSPIF